MATLYGGQVRQNVHTRTRFECRSSATLGAAPAPLSFSKPIHLSSPTNMIHMSVSVTGIDRPHEKQTTPKPIVLRRNYVESRCCQSGNDAWARRSLIFAQQGADITLPKLCNTRDEKTYKT